MPRSVQEILREVARERKGSCLAEKDPSEDTSEEQLGLLEAWLTWAPDKGPLENDERVQKYLRVDPENLKVVRALQLLLLVKQRAGGARNAE